MPLYMDFHQFDAVTVEDVKKAHIADLSVQEKYGVRYLQFWVNELTGSVFCLMEGPGPEACEKCHQKAHGNIACNIQEVEAGFFNLFMGKGLPTDNHLTLTSTGDIDVANRTILVTDIRGNISIKDVVDYKLISTSHQAKELVRKLIEEKNGRFVEYSTDDSLIGVFVSSVDAIRCAKSIQDKLLKSSSKVENDPWNIEFRISLNQGQPLTETGGFFQETLNKSKRLCLITHKNEILLSHNLLETYSRELVTDAKETSIHILSQSEEKFVDTLFKITEEHLTTQNFNVGQLSRMIGVSRPQLYRKTSALTGKSPNVFIRDFRLDKARTLIKNKKGNVTEVAMQVGFSNPSYFSQLFKGKFGYSPSALH